jgi:cell filamentation protein
MNVRHLWISGCCIWSDSSRFYIHPFREGNGRTQRIFWNRLALEAGWQLDWQPIHGEENHAAARAGSDDEDLEPLITMFEKVVTLPSAQDDRWPSEEIQRLSIRPSNSQ